MPRVPGRNVEVLEATRPAIVLGSTQPLDVVDTATADRLRIEVVRRRSGGGAVVLVPGETVWIDVLIGRDDPLWVDDVGRAAWWLGDAWRDALGSLGVADATVHRGPMLRPPVSGLVCFAGTAPGEVMTPHGKAVGISQRRTRDGARFQCALTRRWRPELYAALLGVDERAVEGTAAEIDASAEDAVRALVAALPR